VVELLSDESDVEPLSHANNGPPPITSAQLAPPLPHLPAAAPPAADGLAVTLARRVEPGAAVAPLTQPPRWAVAVARESGEAVTDAADEADDEGDGWALRQQWTEMDSAEQGLAGCEGEEAGDGQVRVGRREKPARRGHHSRGRRDGTRTARACASMAAGAASAVPGTSPAALSLRKPANRPAVGCGGTTSSSSSSSSSSGAGLPGLPRSEPVAPSHAAAETKRRRRDASDIDAAAVAVEGTATSASLSSRDGNAASLPARVASAQAAAWPSIPRRTQVGSAACAPTGPGSAFHARGLAVARRPVGENITTLSGGRSLQELMNGVDRDLPMPARENSDADARAAAGRQSAGAGTSSARASGAEPRVASGAGVPSPPVAPRTQHTSVGPRCLEHRCSGAAHAPSASMTDSAAPYGLRQQQYSAGPRHASDAASCHPSLATEELASLVRGGTAHVEASVGPGVRGGVRGGVYGTHSVCAAGAHQLFDFGLPDSAAAPPPPAAVLDVLLTPLELCSELIATALAAGEATPLELLNGMVPADMDEEAQQEWMAQLYVHMEATALPQRGPESGHIAADRSLCGSRSSESGGGTSRAQPAHMGAAHAAPVSEIFWGTGSRVQAGRSVEEQGSWVNSSAECPGRRPSELRRQRAPEHTTGLTHAYWEAQLPVGYANPTPQATTSAPLRQPLVQAAPRSYGLGGLGIAERDSVLREL